jgi:hypothetical protein
MESKLKQSIEEINRGNTIIEKTRGDYKSTKHKLKLKSSVVLQQE